MKLRRSEAKRQVDPLVEKAREQGRQQLGAATQLFSSMKVKTFEADQDAHIENIQDLIDKGMTGRLWPEVVTLVRAVSGQLCMSKMWGAWEAVLERGLEAAHKSGDRSGEAFALHELGVRSLGSGELDQANGFLTQALQIRTELGELDAAAATQKNLNVLQQLRARAQSEDGFDAGKSARAK